MKKKILLVILILVIVSGGVFYYLNKNNIKDLKNSTTEDQYTFGDKLEDPSIPGNQIAGVSSSTNSRTYIDNEGKFEINYPSDWILDDEDTFSSPEVKIDYTDKEKFLSSVKNDPGIISLPVDKIVVSTQEKESLIAFMKLYSGNKNYSKVPTFKEYTNLYINNILKESPETIITNSIDTVLDGNPAHRIEYPWKDGALKMVEIFTIKDDILYQINVLTTSKRYGPELEGVIQNSTNSFKITNLKQAEVEARKLSVSISETKKSDWKTYKDDEYHFEMSYPSNWQYEKSTRKPQEIFFYPPISSSGVSSVYTNGHTLKVMLYKISEFPGTAGSYLNILLDQVKKNPSTNNLISKPITIFGNVWQLLSFTSTETSNLNQPLSFYGISLEKNGITYSINYNGSAQETKTFEDTFQKMIKSVKIN